MSWAGYVQGAPGRPANTACCASYAQPAGHPPPNTRHPQPTNPLPCTSLPALPCACLQEFEINLVSEEQEDGEDEPPSSQAKKKQKQAGGKAAASTPAKVGITGCAGHKQHNSVAPS